MLPIHLLYQLDPSKIIEVDDIHDNIKEGPMRNIENVTGIFSDLKDAYFYGKYVPGIDEYIRKCGGDMFEEFSDCESCKPYPAADGTIRTHYKNVCIRDSFGPQTVNVSPNCKFLELSTDHDNYTIENPEGITALCMQYVGTHKYRDFPNLKYLQIETATDETVIVHPKLEQLIIDGSYRVIDAPNLRELYIKFTGKNVFEPIKNIHPECRIYLQYVPEPDFDIAPGLINYDSDDSDPDIGTGELF